MKVQFLSICIPWPFPPVWGGGGSQLGSDVWWEIFPTRPWSPAVGPTKLVSPFSLPSISSFFSRLLLLGMGMFLLSTLAWLRL